MWTTPPHCLISGQLKRVLNVPYSDILTGYQYSDHIKAIRERRRTVSIHPNAGAPPEFPALAVVDGLHRVPEQLATTRLDFHERDVVSTAHDQVDIPMPATESMRHEAPTVAPHPTRRDPFAKQP